jgi:hypothetical protein
LNSFDIVSIGFLLVFILAWLFTALIYRKRPVPVMRELSVFTHLRQAVGLAVEAGKRIHITLGYGNPISPQIASAWIGLGIVERIARLASVGDLPPLASSGEGATAILSQDTLRSTYRSIGAAGQFQPGYGQVTGLTALSYAGGTIPVISDGQVAATICAGHFGSEIGLILEASERQRSLTLAGSDNLTAQAVIVAAADEPLIGEELFATSAYTQPGIMQNTNLQAHDIIRWLLIIGLVAGAVLRFLGF